MSFLNWNSKYETKNDNNQIQDLLRPESCNMQIREGKNGVYVSGVEEVQVKSVEDTMKLLMLGERHRCLSFTKLVRQF